MLKTRKLNYPFRIQQVQSYVKNTEIKLHYAYFMNSQPNKWAYKT